MNLLGTGCLMAGYTLVYAAVVGGKHPTFAKDPWMGLIADAYEINKNQTTATTTAANGGGSGGQGSGAGTATGKAEAASGANAPSPQSVGRRAAATQRKRGPVIPRKTQTFPGYHYDPSINQEVPNT